MVGRTARAEERAGALQLALAWNMSETFLYVLDSISDEYAGTPDDEAPLA